MKSLLSAFCPLKLLYHRCIGIADKKKLTLSIDAHIILNTKYVHDHHMLLTPFFFLLGLKKADFMFLVLFLVFGSFFGELYFWLFGLEEGFST